MNRLRTTAAIGLAAILAASAYGWWSTAPATQQRRASRDVDRSRPLVDRSALDTANRLLPLATTAGERALAEDAAAAADHLLDLAFAAALREATDHPPPVTPAIRAAQQQLDRSAQQLVTDNLEIQRLAAESSKAAAGHNGTADAELALARSQFEVDQYDFDQAGKALLEAGGDPRGRIQALVAEHQATTAKPAPVVAAGPAQAGLVHLLGRWQALRGKRQAIATARAEVGAALASLATARDALARRIQAQAAAARPGGTRAGTADALLASTQQIAVGQQELRSIDERRAGEQDLGRLYDRWLALVAADTTTLVHRILRDVIVIAGACLLLMFFGSWLGSAFDRLRVDRRQVETLRTVTTVALQVAAVFFILLVIIGPPSQLATILGLAGAGLTVALKDFIVAFIGWLVLMGRNGIRIGDWVEINGVAGEVVELGMFHTVLLETGNWTDSGHPTGRRVTFTNSFAIQGYYFNFSTSGQWLWDELQLVVPAGQDLYAVVGQISKRVQDATAENVRLAEEEWRRAAPALKLTGLSAAPAINVKPVLGGTEIALRYIARASERHALRARLYEAAVELLAKQTASAPVT
jgi:small-conductance mechanosensitive channel